MLSPDLAKKDGIGIFGNLLQRALERLFAHIELYASHLLKRRECIRIWLGSGQAGIEVCNFLRTPKRIGLKILCFIAEIHPQERLAHTIHNVAEVEIDTDGQIEWVSIRELRNSENTFVSEALRDVFTDGLKAFKLKLSGHRVFSELELLISYSSGGRKQRGCGKCTKEEGDGNTDLKGDLESRERPSEGDRNEDSEYVVVDIKRCEVPPPQSINLVRNDPHECARKSSSDKAPHGFGGTKAACPIPEVNTAPPSTDACQNRQAQYWEYVITTSVPFIEICTKGFGVILSG